MRDVTSSRWDVVGVMWDVKPSMWTFESSVWDIKASMHAAYALCGVLQVLYRLLNHLCGLLQPACMPCRSLVGYTSFMWTVVACAWAVAAFVCAITSMKVITSSVYDAITSNPNLNRQRHATKTGN